MCARESVWEMDSFHNQDKRATVNKMRGEDGGIKKATVGLRERKRLFDFIKTWGLSCLKDAGPDIVPAIQYIP